MNDLLVFLVGVTLGTYFSEEVRDVVPILDKSKEVQQ